MKSKGIIKVCTEATSQYTIRQISVVNIYLITPHVYDVMGVIVLASSVCVSVCPSVSLSRLNGQTYELEYWHGGQVEGYLGQIRKSEVKVTRSKNVHWDYPLTSESQCQWTCHILRNNRKEYDVGCFQSACVFFFF